MTIIVTVGNTEYRDNQVHVILFSSAIDGNKNICKKLSYHSCFQKNGPLRRTATD